MLRSRLVGYVLVAAVGWIPIAPPEHVHEEEEHGHETLLVHRHLGAHALLSHASGHEQVLDHEDAPILTFESVYVVPAAQSAVAEPPSIVVATIDPPAGEILHRSRDYVERLIHGPPRAPTSLRAPPAVSRL